MKKSHRWQATGERRQIVGFGLLPASVLSLMWGNRFSSLPIPPGKCDRVTPLRGGFKDTRQASASRWMWGYIIIAVFLRIVSTTTAQELPFPQVSADDEAGLAPAMSKLAEQAIAAYKESGDRAAYLDNLFRAQIVAERHTEAEKTLSELRLLTSRSASRQAAANNVPDEIFVRAKIVEAADHVAFEEAFRRSFNETFQRLSDPISALVIRTFSVPARFLRSDVDRALQLQKGKSSIALPDALRLIHAYQIDREFRAFGPLADNLITEDDQRRYVSENDIQVKTPDGATLCARIIRPKHAGRFPALLEFTIYNYTDPTTVNRDMRRTASNGYVAVEGFTRGKACSPDQPIPYVHDGADAATLIEWIAKQEWSDGRVGMYGGSYSGFTAWAATKFMPRALKAIMVGAAVGPGIDVPMEGNVFWNFIYPWPFYTCTNKTLDDATYNDHARWQALDTKWYRTGRAYRDLDKIDGMPNPIFNRWISHPSYDSYWQSVIPYGREFARI
ncbi:MAG TPA: CocE/NonD family hydrolase, partial [Chthoniobacterales bacterium]|nr:CocE/NonD family hydrolase [Chthoniobacterales bacterium]